MPFTIISTFFLKEAATRIRENLRASYLDEFINEKLELSSANTKRHAPRTIYHVLYNMDATYTNSISTLCMI
jgi:hypothetical protein